MWAVCITHRHHSITQKSSHFFHTLSTPCHTCASPVTGWTGNAAVRAGGRPPGACRSVRREDGGGSCTGGFRWQPDQRRGALRPSQPPEKSLPLVPGQRRPAARAGMETGLWRAALRIRGGCLTSDQAPGAPGSSTQGPARAGRCHPPLKAARVRAANKRHAIACRMRTPSGDIRARAQSAPPRMQPRKRGMHTKPTSERHSLRAALRTGCLSTRWCCAMRAFRRDRTRRG
jgi:hypothetical protein